MQPRNFLRIEGLTVLVLMIYGYFTMNGPIWMFILLILAPDLSMLGYLAGPRFGSLIYNIAHTYTLPITLGAIGFWANIQIAIFIALIWTAHIGIDRLFGYGLKFKTGFKNTHLSHRLHGPKSCPSVMRRTHVQFVAISRGSTICSNDSSFRTMEHSTDDRFVHIKDGS